MINVTQSSSFHEKNRHQGSFRFASSFSETAARAVKEDLNALGYRRCLKAILTVAVCGLFSGCTVPVHQSRALSHSHGQNYRPTETFGYSVEGRPITGHVLGSGSKTFILFGVIHGNEPIGKYLLNRLKSHLVSRPEILRDKRVVLVPVVNPDGFENRTRHNARSVDLNRNFPSSCWVPRRYHGTAPASEPETRALLQVLRRFPPDRVLSIHAPLRCVNFDGPAASIAEDIAAATAYPVRASIGYPTPGSFGRYAGWDLNIPSITLEAGREASDSQAWRTFLPGLLAFLEGSSDDPLTAEQPSAGRRRRARTGR